MPDRDPKPDGAPASDGPPSPSRAPDRVPDLLVERLRLRELDPARAAAVLRRLEAEPGGVERLTALAASDEQLLAAHPPQRVAAVIRHRAEAQRAGSRRRSLVLGTGALVGAAAALLLVVRPGGDVAPGPAAGDHVGLHAGALDDGHRLKGLLPDLRLHRQTDAGPEPLDDGDEAQAYDLVQLSYVAAGARSGVLLSIDGRGAVTLHFPDDVRASARLRGGGTVALEHAYELDDAPEYERFVFVSADSELRPPDVQGILDAAEALAADPARARDALLDLPDAYEQRSLLLRKGPRRGAPGASR